MAFEELFDDLITDALDGEPPRRPLNVAPMVMVLVAALTVAIASVVQLVVAGDDRLAVGELPPSTIAVPVEADDGSAAGPGESPAPVTIPLPTPAATRSAPPIVGPEEQRSGGLDAVGGADDTDRPTPAALRLVALGTEAPVVPVGVTEERHLEIPAVDRVGWYRLGARPGEDGSAVLAAHVDYGGRAGVFARLAMSQAGDALEVGFDDGTTRAFTVVAVRQYPKEELPLADLFSHDGEPSLALITCGGAFDASLRSYEDNVVVYAVPA